MTEKKNPHQSNLDTLQIASLEQVVANYSPLQLAWASGYLASKSNSTYSDLNDQPSISLTILYGTQTGNAEYVAEDILEFASSQNIQAKVINMIDYPVETLKRETHLLIVVSTTGDGDPPDDAMALHKFISSEQTSDLAHLHYSVLALGNTSYDFFCQAGRDFDEGLEKLGAQRMVSRVDCDIDYDDNVQQWLQNVFTEMSERPGSINESSNTVPDNNTAVNTSSNHSTSDYNKNKPFLAKLISSEKITGQDSNKEVYHIEIDLNGSDLDYQPGDALGVYFRNDTALVDELLETLALNKDSTVTISNKTFNLLEALTEQLDITQTSIKFVETWAKLSADKELLAIMNNDSALREFTARTQLVDIIGQAPTKIDAQNLVDLLRKMTPRLYSIASSQADVDKKVHLTVSLVLYLQDGKTRFGGASGFLSNRLIKGDNILVFIEHNHNFRLPPSDDTPTIMIGPGTGIAPFRAFLQERDARYAEGDNWLFFGEQTVKDDFLYQFELQNYFSSGLLTHLDLAFSRDQTEKVYVQHRIKENAAEIYQWIEERGAHIYICGDQHRMAKDVHNCLVEIIAEQGLLSNTDAENYLKDLRMNKRYQKDVY